MKNVDPTKKDIEGLTSFLTILYDHKIKIYSYLGSDLFSGGLYKYHPQVEKFFEIASRPCWNDYEYTKKDVSKMIEPGKIEAASLAEIKTTLTYCVRLERFCEGHWIEVIESAVIKRILERLRIINQ